jgi:hypothetical protein
MTKPAETEAGQTVVAHRFAVTDRVAWSDGPQRVEGEGVVVELLPPTPEDGQPRYRIVVFVDGRQTAAEIELVDGVVYAVPGWAAKMPREERLRLHQGRTPPWNEEIRGG